MGGKKILWEEHREQRPGERRCEEYRAKQKLWVDIRDFLGDEAAEILSSQPI